VSRAEEYAWSSAASHTGIRDDPLVVREHEILKQIDDWAEWLAEDLSEPEIEQLRELPTAVVRSIHQASWRILDSSTNASSTPDHGDAPSSHSRILHDWQVTENRWRSLSRKSSKRLSRKKLLPLVLQNLLFPVSFLGTGAT
jgi:hypothetical protein